MDLVVATRNAGKLLEIQDILEESGIKCRSLADFPELPPIAETGASFVENALIKARAVAQRISCPTLADDSGLEVETLGGRPGVRSARFAGEQASDADNNARLLLELDGVPPQQRQARFVCALALVVPGGATLIVTGDCAGQILEQGRGRGGFGYDPLFWLPELDKTFAELTPQEKSQRSHRGQALAKLKQELPGFLK